ncbi:LysM peptidoglycan-binding domain-containing protein [Lentilactobacillus hilgardii]|uniref:aggregation-promoting factor n=1 Tax=Lentilactobacillus hilgardii TaxID=1588 RepID=UPI003FA5D294
MILATSAAAVGLFFAGFSYASAATVVTIQSGDTVWGLSQKYNVSVDAINQANNLSNCSVIIAGEKINIPDGSQASSTTQSTSQTASYSQPQYKQATQSTTQSNAATTNNAGSTYSASANTGATDSNSAKSWIASHESGGSYSARNGQYVGKYQLSASYLNGDYSAANQEKVANQYVANRYGSWSAAKSFWQANGWY